jgi:hypothetical protein
VSQILAPPVGVRNPIRAFGPLVAAVGGGVSGGTILGLGLAAMTLLTSQLPGATVGLMLALSCMAVVGLAWPSTRIWLPHRAAQVRAEVMLRHRKFRTAGQWGFELGLGVATHLVTPAFYAFVGIVLGSGEPALAVVAGASYGFARLLTIAIAAAAHRHIASGEDESPVLFLAGMERRTRFIFIVAISAAVFVTV